MIQDQFENISYRQTALPFGFAAAVLPVSAATITTDSDGLFTSDVLIEVSDGEIPGYIARPKDGENLPVVIVVHEIFGVHEHIKDVCRRFAKEGYLAVAPQLFVRYGELAGLTDFADILKIVSKAPDKVVMEDIDATYQFAMQNGGDPNRASIVGFCWGGRTVWLYSAHSNLLKAGVAFYGKLVGQHTELQPQYPVDIVQSLKIPVLGLYGGQDHGIPLDTVETMQALCKAADADAQITVFRDAGHAFFADYRPSFEPESAKRAWDQTMAFLKSHGV